MYRRNSVVAAAADLSGDVPADVGSHLVRAFAHRNWNQFDFAASMFLIRAWPVLWLCQPERPRHTWKPSQLGRSSGSPAARPNWAYPSATFCGAPELGLKNSAI